MSQTTTEQKKEAPLSRLGRKPVEIPAGVKVSVSGQKVQVQGTRGTLSWSMPEKISAKVEGNAIQLFPTENTPKTKALHGLSRKLVLNMVVI
jgi:large subunit ribosomal protein L6